MKQDMIEETVLLVDSVRYMQTIESSGLDNSKPAQSGELSGAHLIKM
jgi:hypothetical protein